MRRDHPAAGARSRRRRHRQAGAGAFHATLLDQILRLRGIEQLVVTGVTADVCVKTTLHEANDRGYECLLVEDAIASYAPAFTAAVVAMARVGVTGSTIAAAPLLAALESMIDRDGQA